jgi:hypothetical protein
MTISLMDSQGCIFIHPEDAMKYHQCDFDGDQLVCTPYDLLPTIAGETRTAQMQLDLEGNDLNRDFKPVVKKEKQAYAQADLKHMALAVRLNSIGRIANAIGRVNCAQPNPAADIPDQQYFLDFKAGMMDALFDSLQVEVDSPKSAHVKQLFAPFHDPQIARHHDLIDLKKAQQTLFTQDPQLYNQLFSFTTGNKKYNPVSIVAPRHMNWLMGQTSRKAALVFAVLPERVSQALGQEISQVQLLGKDKNAFAQHDFNSAYYQGRELNFIVSTFNNPNLDRHGDPMVYMQHPGDGNYYSLGMFAQDSPKLPLSASFTAQAKAIANEKTVALLIKPGSMSVPQPELPQSSKKLSSKARRQEVVNTQRTNQACYGSKNSRHLFPQRQ